MAFGADVALDLAEPIDRQVQRAAVVLELERIDLVLRGRLMMPTATVSSSDTVPTAIFFRPW